ncbi:hypothetical protein [Solitalea koreensis]|uniref:Uncharacterized protein n=1 Tax=Solitalea koreensis TaxID=543615 RepID=A0A521CZP6_9SPHI|nr:hypothetical protein [Solitalea koreensis]SMO64925.1 hypothetical protein SAMN06265350_10564 [Solitalea koreensis]
MKKVFSVAALVAFSVSVFAQSAPKKEVKATETKTTAAPVPDKKEAAKASTAMTAKPAGKTEVKTTTAKADTKTTTAKADPKKAETKPATPSKKAN